MLIHNPITRKNVNECNVCFCETIDELVRVRKKNIMIWLKVPDFWTEMVKLPSLQLYVDIRLCYQ